MMLRNDRADKLLEETTPKLLRAVCILYKNKDTMLYIYFQINFIL